MVNYRIANWVDPPRPDRARFFIEIYKDGFFAGLFDERTSGWNSTRFFNTKEEAERVVHVLKLGNNRIDLR